MAYKIRTDITSPDRLDVPPDYGDGWCYLVLEHNTETCTVLSEYGIDETVFETIDNLDNMDIVIMSWD